MDRYENEMNNERRSNKNPVENYLWPKFNKATNG